MIVHDFEQYSDAWWQVRCGLPTASRFASIMSANPVWQVWLDGEQVSNHRELRTAQSAADKLNKKSGGHVVRKVYPMSEGAEGYACELIADQFDPCYGHGENYESPAMRKGTIMEPKARSWYEFATDTDIKQVGFCTTDDGLIGSSPDGLAVSDGEFVGALELKSPEPKTHVRYLADDILPPVYKPQCHGHLIVTGLPWCDFMSYCPGFPEFRIRVEPDDYTQSLREALAEFIEIMASIRARLPLVEPEAPEPITEDMIAF